VRKSIVPHATEPEDEQELARLEKLRSFSILDSLPEQSFEDITALASFICGTPISLISFVDEQRQWFKSKLGLGASETPRSQSFCANTIPTQEMLVVEDAQADPRFRDNPLVLGGPNIRFYAGAPILQAGHVLGTVCVIDTIPRSLSAKQLSALQALARQTSILLDQRKGLMDAKREAKRLSDTRENLRQSEAQMTLAAEAAGIASWYFDPARNVVGGDALMGKIFGVPGSEGPAEDWLNAIHPEDRDRVGKEFADGVSGKPYDTEYRLLHGESLRWVRAKARLLSAGGQQRMAGICEDVTSRKLIEESLRSTAERLRLAQSAGRVATWEWNLSTGALIWGDESLWAYGRPPEEISHIETALQFLHPDDLAGVMERVKPAIEGTGEYNVEFRILWPDGSIHWSQGFGKPVLSASGKPIAIVGFNIDISDRKIADAALIRTEKLAAVGRLASTMAHEINNPLEAVTNLLFLAQNAQNLEQAKPFLDTADTELRRASAITNQALRFHKQATRPTSVSFEELVSGLLSGRHSRLLNSHIVLSKKDRSTQPVLCFEGEIRQVLSNLVGNAIDAMHGRGGTLYLRGRDGRDWRTGKSGLLITIADTGTGMSRITQAKLFDAFFTTKGIGGTGLGLWISKEILDRHHGRIAFKSREQPGLSGTIFTVFLPFDAVVRQLA
jgi:PAS domain S-box-containing protein